MKIKQITSILEKAIVQPDTLDCVSETFILSAV